MAALHYRELASDPSLADRIDCYWSLSAEFGSGRLAEHWVLPNGCTNLVYWLPGGFASPFRAARKLLLVGPIRRAFRRPLLPGECFLGIRMKPGTVPVIAGKPIADLTDKTISLHSVVGICLMQWESLLSATSNAAESFPLLHKLLRVLLRAGTPVDDAMIEAASALRAERGGPALLATLLGS